MIGIDVGTYSIKVVDIVEKGDGHEVLSIASAYNPVGHYFPSEPKQQELLLGTIKTLLSEQKLIGKQVSLSLPENQVYSSIVEMPWLTDVELSSAIQWEAEQHLPVSLDSVNLEYSVLYRPEHQDQGKMTVLLVAAKKDLVERVTVACDYLEVEIVSLEPSLLGVGRTLLKTYGQMGSVMVCNIGALSSDLMILTNNLPVFMHSIPVGGLALTRAIEKGLSMQPSQAEEYKRTYGLRQDQLEGKVFSVLTPVLNSILSEIRKAMQFYQSKGGGVITKIILYGGCASLPALPAVMTQSLGTEVALGNAFETLILSDLVRLPKDTSAFAVASGLAMREEE